MAQNGDGGRVTTRETLPMMNSTTYQGAHPALKYNNEQSFLSSLSLESTTIHLGIKCREC